MFLVNTQRRVGRTNFSPSRLLPVVLNREKTRSKCLPVVLNREKTRSKCLPVVLNREKTRSNASRLSSIARRLLPVPEGRNPESKFRSFLS